MLLRFPNLDAIRLALTSGLIPEDVRHARVRALLHDPGPVWANAHGAIDRKALRELRHLGVIEDGQAPTPLDQEFTCWMQLLPLEKESRDWSQAERMPILFELAGAGALGELSAEMLRLGNDRQGFRWIEDGAGSRGLLRVVGPPYYSLLRALDRRDDSLLAYREIAPRIWCQLGYVHPLAALLHPPAGTLLLLRPPRDWRFVSEAPFRDIYEVIDFALPQPESVWHDTPRETRWRVPLRLQQGSAAEAAELWVLRGEDGAQVDELVSHADDQLLARLAFAVGTQGDRKVIVLRVRPSRLPPPVVVLPGVAFRPYLRLPNLFVPCGARLQPPLRRDAVVKLLASDTRRLTWLYPGAAGAFTPESLPEDAFRPLRDWVEYVLDVDQQPLEAWVQSATFDFESFVCRDDQPAHRSEPPKPRPQKEPERKSDTPDEPPAAVDIEIRKARRRKKEDAPVEFALPARPTEVEEKLRLLEKRFLEEPGPLDSPARQALWPQMAQLNTVLRHADGASACWAHALWGTDALPPAWLLAWYAAERPKGERPPAPREVAQILASANPSLNEVRAVVAALLYWSSEAPAAAHDSESRAPLLGRLQGFLEQHEASVGARVAWLGWLALHRLAHGDILGLTRARDRLLERLFVNGLSADLDLPSFLRFTGARAGERFRLVREHLLRLRGVVEKWPHHIMVPAPATDMYADLIFAYGLARLGEASEAQKLVQRASGRLATRDFIHVWLVEAFEYRIDQAAKGQAALDRLPEELLRRLDDMDKLSRYKIDRLRQHSRILEPHEKIDPYRRWFGRFADELSRQLASLCDLHNRSDLTEQIERLLAQPRKGAAGQQAEARVLGTALELGPRLGEAFAAKLLERTELLVHRLTEPLDQALLLEKAVYLAAHYDKRTELQDLIDRLRRLLQAGKLPVTALESLLGHSFRSLRKLGLRDEVGGLLEDMAQLIERDPQLQAAADAANTAPARIQRLLLQVAGGWLFFGQEERARQVLDQTRALLLSNEMSGVEQTSLACAYATTLAQAPVELAVQRLLELCRRVDGIQDTFTTNSHYSLSRLDLAEAVVLALVNEDLQLDPQVRRWLDEDEYLVRRRIHRDLRAALEKAGM